jgi:hypothetical protein
MTGLADPVAAAFSAEVEAETSPSGAATEADAPAGAAGAAEEENGSRSDRKLESPAKGSSDE